jgi:hypothetical protein
LLPAGAVAGWDLHPLESAAFARRTPRNGHNQNFYFVTNNYGTLGPAFGNQSREADLNTIISDPMNG